MPKKVIRIINEITLCQNNGTKENPRWVPMPDWAEPKLVKQNRGGWAYTTNNGTVYVQYRALKFIDIFKEVQKLNGFKDNKKK